MVSGGPQHEARWEWGSSGGSEGGRLSSGGGEGGRKSEFWHATYCLKPLINLCIIIVIIKTCLGGKGLFQGIMFCIAVNYSPNYLTSSYSLLSSLCVCSGSFLWAFLHYCCVGGSWPLGTAEQDMTNRISAIRFGQSQIFLSWWHFPAAAWVISRLLFRF